MKQHLPTTGERVHAPAPARCEGHPQLPGTGRPRPYAAPRTNVHAAATCADRIDALGTDGTWPTTAFARIAMVFAPYHQRPEDSVT